MWPDIEIELVALLATALGVRHCTDLPANLVSELPLNQVQRVGGDDDGFRLDRALISLDSYGATREEASVLARQARHELVVNLRGVKTATAVIGRVATLSAPAWRPYENPNLRRMGATYEIYFHPVA
ncbi:hypothetical protein [Streptomyces sp. NPDC088794]|uniref:hypothetical protein n=1 Tax=Streptomyces sp. NPDC088794 TaxID=3365902 RepID=UPI00380C1362